MKTEKQMLQSMAHGQAREWLTNLKELHERQVRELTDYIDQFDKCAANEVSDSPDSRMPTTIDVLSWGANQVNFVVNNARVDRLTGLASAIVMANSKR